MEQADVGLHCFYTKSMNQKDGPSHMYTAKAQNSQHTYIVWSGPSLSAYRVCKNFPNVRQTIKMYLKCLDQKRF